MKRHKYLDDVFRNFALNCEMKTNLSVCSDVLMDGLLPLSSSGENVLLQQISMTN